MTLSQAMKTAAPMIVSWLWLVGIFVFIYFGWTNALIGLVAFLLMELSLDLKRMNLSVLAIYSLFEQQAQEERDGAELEQIEDALARTSGTERDTALTWPPVSH